LYGLLDDTTQSISSLCLASVFALTTHALPT
jgi:hypothetical protein